MKNAIETKAKHGCCKKNTEIKSPSCRTRAVTINSHSFIAKASDRSVSDYNKAPVVKINNLHFEQKRNLAMENARRTTYL